MRAWLGVVSFGLPLGFFFACGGATPPAAAPPQPSESALPAASLSAPAASAAPSASAAPADSEVAAAMAAPLVQVLAKNQQASTALAVDRNAAYWIDEADGTLTRVPKRGGVTMLIFSATGGAFTGSESIAVDDTDIYWTAQTKQTSALSHMNKNGGKTTTVASGSSASPLTCVVVDFGAMYWVSGGAIMKASKDGGAAASIAGGQHGANCVAVDDDRVYWSVGGTDAKQYKDGAIVAAAKKGGAPKVVVKDAERAANVHVDESNVYWVSGDKVMKAAKAGGAATAIATAPGPVGDLALDARFAYFTSYKSGSDGVVVRVPKDGSSTAETIAKDQNQPAGIAVDNDAVYWTCRGTEEKQYHDGTVNKAPKP